MLHHFGVLESFGFDFVYGREVHGIGCNDRKYAGKGNDKAAHTAIMPSRRVAFYFLAMTRSREDGLRFASRMDAIAPQISAPKIATPRNSVTTVVRKSGDQ
jgi:hypothetical protein